MDPDEIGPDCSAHLVISARLRQPLHPQQPFPFVVIHIYTGDLAVMNPDGYVKIKDRKDIDRQDPEVRPAAAGKVDGSIEVGKRDT